MKAPRFLSLLTPPAALLVGIASASAEFHAIDDFDGKALGDIRLASDWSGSNGTGTVELDPLDSQNRLLALRTNSGILRRPLLVPDSGGQMLFFRLRFGDQQNYSLGLSPNTSPSEFSDFATEIGMANAPSDLRVWDDGVGHYIDLVTLQQDTWYNVWVYADTTDNIFQIWINDDGCGDADARDQLDDADNNLFGFRSGSGSDLRSFFIKTGGGQGGPDGPVYIDDIYLDDTPGSVNLDNPTSPRDGYFEDFESGLRGWRADGPSLQTSGGVGDSAYLQGQRDRLAPIFLPEDDSAGKHLFGNLEQCYGPEIHISYYGRTFVGNSDPIFHNFFIESLDDLTYWNKAVAPSGAPFLSEWTRVDIFVDTRWSDAEAEAHGWTRLRGSDSWAATLTNVRRQEFFKGSGNTGAPRTAGIDNIRIKPSTVPLDGLVAYYPFNGNAHDVSDNGDHGTVSGAMLTRDAACRAEGAYDLDGNDFISVPGFTRAPIGGTIAAWATVESFETGDNQLNLIFGQNDNLQLGLGDRSVGADGKWVFRHRGSSGFTNVAGPSPELNRWTHVAGVWDGADAILYLDGVEIARATSRTLIASAGAARIGAHPFAAQNYWDGQIDEVLLYDRALTPTEIAHLASSVAYSDEPPRITMFEISPTGAGLYWQPPLERAVVEFSRDLSGWTPISEQLNGCNWSGDLPAPPGTRAYLRVRSQPAPP